MLRQRYDFAQQDTTPPEQESSINSWRDLRNRRRSAPAPEAPLPPLKTYAPSMPPAQLPSAGLQPPALPRFAPPQQGPMMPQVPPTQPQPGGFNPGFMQLLQSLGRSPQAPGAPGGQQPGANQQQIMAALSALAGMGG